MTSELAGESLRTLRISVTTLGDLLLAAADRHPDADALVLPESRLRYRELAGRALRRARALRALGVRPGDKVGLLLPNSPDWVETLFGIALAGGTGVPIDTRCQPAELGQIVEHADLVTLVATDRSAADADFVERLTEALPGLADADPYSLELEAAPALRNVVLLGQSAPPGFVGQPALEDLAGRVPEDEVHRARLSVRVRDTAILAYTTGATAGPRGCLLTHEALVRNAIALGRHRYRLRPEDRYWSPLPLSDVAAMLALAAVLDAGGAYVTMAGFDAGVALQQLQRERVTVADLRFPAHLADLTRHPEFAGSDLSQVRLMNSNLPLQPPGSADPLLKAAPRAIQVGTFGRTETAGTVTTSRLDDTLQQRRSRLGKPLPGLEVRIADPETGEDLPAGQGGEVLVHGYSLLEGYYKDPGETARALDAGGWYHTGDIGSLDADGSLQLHGRRQG